MKHKKLLSGGFTLAEVVLAVAVVAFGLVAVLGVLPVGLNTTRDNRDETMIVQDVEFWMNGIRGGRLSMDALNNVEWVELTELSGDSNRTYRADYATISSDYEGFELGGLLPVFPGPDAQLERAKYIGQLKQAGWRKDVLGWLSIPGAEYIKRAKIRPLGGTQMNYLNSAKNKEDQYISEAGDLTFTYLLETRITLLPQDIWEIRLRAQWPIIEEKFNPETAKMEVKTGPGERTFIGYAAASLESAWSVVDVPHNYERVGPYGLSPEFLFSSFPSDTKLTQEQLSDFLLSLLGSVDTVSQGSEGFVLASGKTKNDALGELLRRPESLQVLTGMLDNLKSQEPFMNELKTLMATHGVLVEETSPAANPGQFGGAGQLGGMLDGLTSNRMELEAIQNGLGIPPGGSVDDLMGAVGSMESQLRGFDDLFAGLGAGLGLNIDLNALMTPEMSEIFAVANSQAGQNNVDLMSLLNQYLKKYEGEGNAEMTANIGGLLGGLGNLNKAGQEMSGLGMPLTGGGTGALLERQQQASRLDSVKQSLGVETMEGVRNRLKELNQKDKMYRDLDHLLMKHGLTDVELKHLFEAHELKNEVNASLTNVLLGRVLPILENSGHLVRKTINGRSYYQQGTAYDSFGRYSLMHAPVTLDEYFDYKGVHPLAGNEAEQWRRVSDQVIDGNAAIFDKIINEGSMWDMKKFLLEVRYEFNGKLASESFPAEKLKGAGDYFRPMYFFRPLSSNH